MDDGELRRVAGALRRFHGRFAPLFGRQEARRHGAQYVRGLLTTREERRNAEHLAEAMVGTEEKAARALQQFLTDSPWRHQAVVAELQRFVGEYLLPEVAAVEGVVADGVWTLDSTGFAKRGTHSAGAARQYSGTLGKVDVCQLGVFLGSATARGHALIDGQLWLPREWIDDPERCRRVGVPEAVLAQGYQSQAEVGLALLHQARTTSALGGRWVTADEAFGQVPTFRDALDAAGSWYVVEVPCTTPVFTAPARTRQVRLRRGAPARPVEIQPATRTVQEVGAALLPQRWTTLTVAQGAQGPRAHRFAALRVRESREGTPGRDGWLVLRRNLDGSEPKSYFSNAPEAATRATLARVGATRWTVETEFQVTKGQVGLDEYEVRSWPGWHHHITLCLLANAFLRSLQRDWSGVGEKAPRGRTLPHPRRETASPAPHAAASGAAPARSAPPAALDARRPAPLVSRNPASQRPRHRRPCQTPADQAA